MVVTSDWQVFKLVETYPQSYTVLLKHNISVLC